MSETIARIWPHPIFSEVLLVTSPKAAKDKLYIHYKSAAKGTYASLCGFGVSETELGSLSLLLAEMMEFDSRMYSTTFGLKKEPTVIMDSLIMARGNHIISSVDSFGKADVADLYPRYISQLTRRFIYYYIQPEDVQAVCEAQGGIPKIPTEWTGVH